KLPRSQVPFVQSSEKSRCHSFSQNFPLFDHFVPLFPHFVPVCTSLYQFVPVCTSFSSLRTVAYRYGLILIRLDPPPIKLTDFGLRTSDFRRISAFGIRLFGVIRSKIIFSFPRVQ